MRNKRNKAGLLESLLDIVMRLSEVEKNEDFIITGDGNRP